MACKLVPVPNSSDFEGQAGQQVTLVTNGLVGGVLISRAEYAGSQLVADDKAVDRIHFTLAEGPKTLKIVFVFSAAITGRGELVEDANPGLQKLRNVAGHEPFQLIRIVGNRAS